MQFDRHRPYNCSFLTTLGLYKNRQLRLPVRQFRATACFAGLSMNVTYSYSICYKHCQTNIIIGLMMGLMGVNSVFQDLKGGGPGFDRAGYW